MVWMMVLLDAICTMKPLPVTTIRTMERATTREKEKAIRPAPNTAAAAGITRHSPTTLRREAR
jgi:hypothetical protein